SDLLGLGVSAISHNGDRFSQNPRDLPSWQIALDEGRLPVFRGMRLEEDDVLRAELIQSLMCQGVIPVAALERRYGIDFAAYFAEALDQLQPLVADGLVRIEPDRIAATTQGRLLLRNIAMCFDRYLTPPQQGDAPGVSRAIRGRARTAGQAPASPLPWSAPGRERNRVSPDRSQHRRRRRRRVHLLLHLRVLPRLPVAGHGQVLAARPAHAGRAHRAVPYRRT